MKLLSRQEEIVLLTIWRLKDDAYGVTIRESISEVTDKYWSIGAIYVPLGRLLDKGFISSETVKTTDKKGGRSRRYYKMTQDGIKALDEIKQVQQTLWKGYPGLAQEEG